MAFLGIIKRIGLIYVDFQRRQMKGRAGRKGKDTVGENFVVCRREDLEAVRAIIDADMPSASSCLTGESEGLRRYASHILLKIV
jgi:replicative superfamily II helicase